MTTPTRISMLLDASGSMREGLTATLSGLKEYIDTLSGDGNSYEYSLVLFNAITTETIYKAVPIKSVDHDTIVSKYKPTGATPLIDAAMRLIQATEQAATTGQKVIVVIQTDGQENASTEFTTADLHKKIKEKTAQGWQFVFLGADIDAYDMARQYGISAASTMSYSKAGQSTGATFRSLGVNTQSYVSGQSACMDWSEQQREAAGEDQVLSRTSVAPGVSTPAKPEKKDDKSSLIDDITV